MIATHSVQTVLINPLRRAARTFACVGAITVLAAGGNFAAAQVSTPFSAKATIDCAETTGDWIGCVGQSAEACVANSNLVARQDEPFCTSPETGRLRKCPVDATKANVLFQSLCYEKEAAFWRNEFKAAMNELRQPILATPSEDRTQLLSIWTEAEKSIDKNSLCFFMFRRLGYEPKTMWDTPEVQLCKARSHMAQLLVVGWANDMETSKP